MEGTELLQKACKASSNSNWGGRIAVMELKHIADTHQMCNGTIYGGQYKSSHTLTISHTLTRSNAVAARAKVVAMFKSLPRSLPSLRSHPISITLTDIDSLSSSELTEYETLSDNLPSSQSVE